MFGFMSELNPGWLCKECGHFRPDDPEDRAYSYGCFGCGARFTTAWVEHHGDYTTETPMDSGNPDDGHTWKIAVSCRGSSKVVGDEHHKDSPQWDDPVQVTVRAWSLREALDQVTVQEYMHVLAGLQVTDAQGVTWVHDPQEETYKPGESVPMPAMVFERAFPEVHALFKAAR